MSTVRRIARNTTALLVAQVASYLLSFFYGMYTARYLGAEGYGVLSFALAFTGIFAVLGDLGLSTLTIREVARDRSLASRFLANVGLVKVALATVAFGLVVLTIVLTGRPDETIKVVCVLALVVVLQAFTQLFYAILQAFERMEFQAIGQMLNAAVILGGVMLAIRHSFGVIGFALLYLVAAAVALGYSLAVTRLKFPNLASSPTAGVREFDRGFWKPAIKEALPFGLVTLFAAIYYGADTIMLSVMEGDAMVGWYNAAYRLVLVLLFIPGAWGSAIFPIMSKFYVTSPHSLRLSIEKSVKYMTMLGIPIGVGTTLLAPRLILAIFGPEYTPSVVALQVLVWSIVITYVCGSAGTLLQTTNNQRVFAKIVGACTVANVGLNLIFVPRYGYIAASAIAVLATLISAVLQWVTVSRRGMNLFTRKFLVCLVKVTVASVIMGVFIRLAGGLPLALLIAIAILIYFAAIFLLKFFDREDLLLIRQLAGKRGSASNA